MLNLGGAFIEGITRSQLDQRHADSGVDVTMDASLSVSFELNDSAYFEKPPVDLMKQYDELWLNDKIEKPNAPKAQVHVLD